MRSFGTQGSVSPETNYIVSRTEEIADFINRIKEGKYVVLFAPRQTGKTTLVNSRLMGSLPKGLMECVRLLILFISSVSSKYFNR